MAKPFWGLLGLGLLCFALFFHQIYGSVFCLMEDAAEVFAEDSEGEQL